MQGDAARGDREAGFQAGSGGHVAQQVAPLAEDRPEQVADGGRGDVGAREEVVADADGADRLGLAVGAGGRVTAEYTGAWCSRRASTQPSSGRRRTGVSRASAARAGVGTPPDQKRASTVPERSAVTDSPSPSGVRGRLPVRW